MGKAKNDKKANFSGKNRQLNRDKMGSLTNRLSLGSELGNVISPKPSVPAKQSVKVKAGKFWMMKPDPALRVSNNPQDKPQPQPQDNPQLITRSAFLTANSAVNSQQISLKTFRVKQFRPFDFISLHSILKAPLLKQQIGQDKSLISVCCSDW